LILNWCFVRLFAFYEVYAYTKQDFSYLEGVMIERYWRNYQWKSDISYYNVHLQHNLLGRWSVISVWGRHTHKSGNSKIKFFDTLNGALSHISLLKQRRAKSSYTALKNKIS